MPDPTPSDEIDAWIPEVIAARLARDIEDRLQTMIAAVAGSAGWSSPENSRMRAQVLQRMCDKLGAVEARSARDAR